MNGKPYLNSWEYSYRLWWKRSGCWAYSLCPSQYLIIYKNLSLYGQRRENESIDDFDKRIIEHKNEINEKIVCKGGLEKDYVAT